MGKILLQFIKLALFCFCIIRAEDESNEVDEVNEVNEVNEVKIGRSWKIQNHVSIFAIF